MRLSSLLAATGLAALPPGAPDPDITAITADSRAVGPGTLFVALPGAAQDGRTFIPAALAAGAVALLVPDGSEIQSEIRADVPVVTSSRPRRTLAHLAALLAGGPQPGHVVAVTGTNGKTSTVDFLRQIWAHAGQQAASFGTLGLVSSVTLPFRIPSLTTPDPVTLARALVALKQAGVDHVAMEASSHGLDQNRLDGVQITAAGFTNLTRDHLDYHGDLDAYRAAKLRLFTELLPDSSVAAANADMEEPTLDALRTIARTKNLKLRLVGEKGDTLRLLRQSTLPEGQELLVEWNGERRAITLALPGRFQADNALLAAALAYDDEAQIATALDALPHLRGVRGRMERATVLPSGAVVYVDFAHTPDALARVLDSLRPHAQGRLVVVFGAGGNRDRGKRPLMAREAAGHADLVIVTDDNPRKEDPAAIRRDVLAGAPDALEIGDRRKAIAAGLDILRPGDVLLVAGKGHEQGQTIGDVVHPFDDASVIRTLVGTA